MHRRDDTGFTLVELVIVILILGVLAAIVVAAIGDSSEQAARNSCAAQIDSVQSAIRRYENNGEGRARLFNSVEDVNTRLIPGYLADELVQVDGFTISVDEGVVTGVYGTDATPCK